MSGEAVVHANESNWKTEVMDSPIPVLVDFWAPWCGPCRLIGPILDEVAVQLAGKLKIVKVNVDENQQLAAQFGVRSIPNLLVIHKGAVQQQMVGALSKAALLNKLAGYV